MISMKKVLPRTLGFFLITLLPLIGLHIVKFPTWGEVIDGVLSSFAFALPFAKANQFLALTIDPKREVYLGMISAAFMWAVLWGFWSAVPEGIRSSMEVWAFNLHLAMALFTGMLTVAI